MKKEAQAIETIRQAAILTVSNYGFDDPLGEHLLQRLTDAADTIGSHFEVFYAFKSYEKTLKKLREDNTAAPMRKITEADALLVKDIITRLCRETTDPELIMEYLEAADYISDCCVRMSEEQYTTA
jgi:hypothetical protein